MPNFSASRRQRGITLIEVMIAIAIALVVAAIAIGLAVAARRDAVTQDLQNQILRVNELATSLSRNGNHATYLDGTTLCRTGNLDNLCASDGEVPQITNAAGGHIFVYLIDDARTLLIRATEIPVSSCISLGTNLSRTFDYMEVDGTLISLSDADGAGITSACQFNDGTDDKGAATFYSGRPELPQG